ncbi:hypothetical protein, partial [Enterobacter cloacae complex sp. GF14B]|uniref:hypothetical protein n=1 Tax=Enterobacter cloacae complex sp. GF14B TaxID=2511982 RepID=UPI0010261BC3
VKPIERCLPVKNQHKDAQAPEKLKIDSLNNKFLHEVGQGVQMSPNVEKTIRFAHPLPQV